MTNYHTAYYHRRRHEWLQANGPCAFCGSWENLEADHIDPSTKSAVLREPNKRSIWLLNTEDRKTELAKCQALCHACHREKSNREMWKEICKYGHAMTPENTYSNSWRARQCNECRKDKIRRQTALKAAGRKRVRDARELEVATAQSPCVSFS